MRYNVNKVFYGFWECICIGRIMNFLNKETLLLENVMVTVTIKFNKFYQLKYGSKFEILNKNAK